MQPIPTLKNEVGGDEFFGACQFDREAGDAVAIQVAFDDGLVVDGAGEILLDVVDPVRAGLPGKTASRLREAPASARRDMAYHLVC